ncbi:MAG: energy coupling factor transporter S component ThiW [Anaerocolumna sp.]
MVNTRKLTLAGILIAVGVVSSPFYIPMGIAKCFPVQHLINVLAGVLLGPFYSVSMAFCTSFIRVILGTGSLLAFPGSMIGALFCGVLYKYTKKVALAFLGEVFGTGILGALAASVMAALFLSGKAAAFGFVIPFGISSLVGAAISLLFIRVLKKTGIFNYLNLEEKKNVI